MQGTRKRLALERSGGSVSTKTERGGHMEKKWNRFLVEKKGN